MALTVGVDILGHLASDLAIIEVSREALRARRVVATGVGGGVGGSASHYLAGAIAKQSSRLVLLMVAHGDDADDAGEELRDAGAQVLRFPALEVLPGESGVSIDLLAQRLAVVQQVLDWSDAPPPPESTRPAVLVASIQSLMQAVPSAAALPRCVRLVRAGETIAGGPAALVRWLDEAGFRRVDAVEEPGDYAARGGILDIFPPGDAAGETEAGESAASGQSALAILPFASGGVPVRLDFFGDDVERLVEIDVETLAADRAVGGVRLVCAKMDLLPARGAGTGTANPDADGVNLIDLLPAKALAVLHEMSELTEQGRGYFERCLDARGIMGPPAVFRAARERLAGTIEITRGDLARGGEGAVIALPVSAAPPLGTASGGVGGGGEVEAAVRDLAELTDATRGAAPLRVVVFCRNSGEEHRLVELIAQYAPNAAGRIAPAQGFMQAGFVWGDTGGGGSTGGGVLYLPYHELLGRFAARGRVSRLRAGRAMDTFLDLQPGDYVVHSEHGIARYLGLTMLGPKEAPRTHELAATGFGTNKPGPKGTLPKGAAAKKPAPRVPAKSESPASSADAAQEHLLLEFEGGAKLHVPAAKCALVQKYVGGFKGKPPLSTLGGQRWRSQKERVGESVKELAAELLRVRAARESMPGIRYPADTAWQRSFEDEFPYDETDDQVAALAEIKRDMQGARPMDRLLCGDVGYGKTEMAIRAAFKAAEFGKQAAVLVPTTVLAEQHERTFRGRFRDYPFKVASVSRFKTDAEVKATLEEVAAGRVDVIIGTHRLLSKDVRFADLGIVIVDEEQRFGVEHKERLLGLRLTADVLTLSATPIPRTLHMAMLGIRDISSLTTAPADRRAVVTEVIPRNTARLKQIIARELAREGQVYYVHNRVHDILSVADEVQKLAPDARIVVGHGQMPDGQLEEVMLKFVRRQADILVSTTIIESGIDIATANTMIIDDADRFGLADLHQLRGRVGRYKHRAYCYLLLPEDRPVKETARQRLKAIEQFSMLGAGFKIAMRDLEIRGAGNILGPEQSGHIAAVGYEMYCQLLEVAVKELRHEPVASPNETALDLGITGVIPKHYIPSDQRRLEAYRRISLARTAADLAKVSTELMQAYGEPPPPVQRLLDLAEVRIGARSVGIRTLGIRDKDLIMHTDQPGEVAARFADARGQVTQLPPAIAGGLPMVYWRPTSPAAFESGTLLVILLKRLASR